MSEKREDGHELQVPVHVRQTERMCRGNGFSLSPVAQGGGAPPANTPRTEDAANRPHP